MMSASQSNKDVRGRWLDVEEVRLIGDLRIMHSKVDEIYLWYVKIKEERDGARLGD